MKKKAVMPLGTHASNVNMFDHFKSAFPEQTGQCAWSVKTDMIRIFQFVAKNQILEAIHQPMGIGSG